MTEGVKQGDMPENRYAKVKDILADAAGGNCSAYGGDGVTPLWLLPRDEFVRFSAYGVPMVALSDLEPETASKESSCCGDSVSSSDGEGSGNADCTPSPTAGRDSAHADEVTGSSEGGGETSEPAVPGDGNEGEVAPPSVSGGHCCGGEIKPAGRIGSRRGERSGLIRGLKGEPPFDGNPFARLPWGGCKTVALDDILFIQDWIDDGCPDPGGETSLPLPSIQGESERQIEVSECVFIFPADDGFLDQPGNKRIRMNLDCMLPGQLSVFRQAVREMYRLNKFRGDWRSYNSLALIHQNHCQHAWERFLPWHRCYMYEFERALNDIIGHSFGLPYWDWTMPKYKAGNVAAGSCIIPESFKAFLTEDSIRCLDASTDLTAEQLCGLEQLIGNTYTSQKEFFTAAAAAIGSEGDVKTYRTQFIDVLLASNSLWYPLRYPAEFFDKKTGDPSTINNVIGYHYPTVDDVAQIQSLNNYRDYGGGSKYDNSYGFLDQNPHNTIHIWSGGQNPEWDGEKKGVQITGRNYHTRAELYTQPQFGDMFSNLTASFDPIFWPHHINVDRLWAEWQLDHPNSNPSDLTAALTPWNYTVRDTLDMSQFGYEYIKSCHRFPVGIGQPIRRFTSEAVEVPQSALDRFRSVEIRLHRVPQLPLSCYVRAFINQPDATPQTEICDNPHYAGYLAIFGHGDCYGGPGHCDIPPRQAAPYDIRERTHNNPRNYRIDATACIKGLIASDAKSFQVSLVVVGADGREMKDFLRLESVTLNFKD